MQKSILINNFASLIVKKMINCKTKIFHTITLLPFFAFAQTDTLRIR